MNETYLAYANFADAVKEVGCRILETIADNNDAIMRYRDRAKEAIANGESGVYYDDFADRLEAQNKLWAELETHLRMKYVEGEGW